MWKICRRKQILSLYPGSGFPQLGEEAAGLYHRDYAPCILPSGRYSILTGHFGGVQEKAELYDGEYETEWGISKGRPGKEPGATERHFKRRSGYLYLRECHYSRKVTDRPGNGDQEGYPLLQTLSCQKKSFFITSFSTRTTRFLVCPVRESDVTRENWFLTEKGTKIVLGEIERIGVQFHEIMREMREADGAENSPE